MNEDNLNLETIILNLKIIAKIQIGNKLCINEKNIYIDNTYFQSIYRYIYDNSRSKTIDFLEYLDKELSIKIENILNNSNNPELDLFLNTRESILVNLNHNIQLSLVGLNNLKDTYDNDQFTKSKIEIIINSFELKIKKISNIFVVNNDQKSSQ
jgi:hypothetical protein